VRTTTFILKQEMNDIQMFVRPTHNRDELLIVLGL